MIKVDENITVREFEEKNRNHIIEQIFNNNLPEYISNETSLKGKTVIVKKFNTKEE